MIGSYCGRPQSCNGITSLGFGNLVNRNFAPNGWVARIYLTDTPRVSFPLNMLNPAQRDRVEVKDGLFAPLDIEVLLRDPDSFFRLRSGDESWCRFRLARKAGKTRITLIARSGLPRCHAESSGDRCKALRHRLDIWVM
jgi:hypothetical protein